MESRILVCLISYLPRYPVGSTLKIYPEFNLFSPLHGYHPDPSHHFFSSEKPHWDYFHPWFFAFCSWHSSQCNYYYFFKSTNYIKLFLNKGPFWSDSALPLWSPHPFVYCTLANQFLTELARPTCTPGLCNDCALCYRVNFSNYLHCELLASSNCSM